MTTTIMPQGPFGAPWGFGPGGTSEHRTGPECLGLGNARLG
ncbi:hypothetical protein [Yinghuangia sp. YIM S10712]